MPWPWELCRHCMDLRVGTFLNWPRSGDWLDNRIFLDAMQTVWVAWRFFRKPAAKWTKEDLEYKDWVDDGRPQTQELTPFEKWKLSQQSNT